MSLGVLWSVEYLMSVSLMLLQERPEAEAAGGQGAEEEVGVVKGRRVNPQSRVEGGRVMSCLCMSPRVSQVHEEVAQNGEPEEEGATEAEEQAAGEWGGKGRACVDVSPTGG